MIIRRLLVPLTLAVVTAHAGPAGAQGAFPAPLPGQQTIQRNDPAFPPVNGTDPAFPPVNGARPTASIGAPPSSSFPVNGAPPISSGFTPAAAPPSQAGGEQCMKEFAPLREEAEKRGKLIKVASDKHASPDEACKLIASFGQAELKMLKYVETHSAKCGIPPNVTDQIRAGHKNTEALQTRVCAMAKQIQQRGPAGPSLSEVLGSATAVPEATAAKKGGSTFDTLNGNVLAR